MSTGSEPTQERERPTAFELKVIGLGLGKTGTLSLCDALEILGFGPCHHPLRRMGIDSEDWGRFAKAVKDGATPEVLEDLYGGYVSAVDSTATVLAEPLYKAYPNAKFILTVRDPAKWAQCISKTICKSFDHLHELKAKVESGTATEIERRLSERLEEVGVAEWLDYLQYIYHQGRLKTDPEAELLRHNQYIKQLIPPEKLLVFDVSEGWKPLADFLGVPEPKEPFPHKNDTARFLENVNKSLQKIGSGCTAPMEYWE